MGDGRDGVAGTKLNPCHCIFLLVRNVRTADILSGFQLLSRGLLSIRTQNGTKTSNSGSGDSVLLFGQDSFCPNNSTVACGRGATSIGYEHPKKNQDGHFLSQFQRNFGSLKYALSR